MLLKKAFKPVQECCLHLAGTARSLSLRVHPRLNQLCFALTPESVVCNSLLATARTEIAGQGLLLNSSVEATVTQRTPPGNKWREEPRMNKRT